MLRYTKLTDAQVLDRLLRVCEAEEVDYDDQGMEAVIFTAEGDMRQVRRLLIVSARSRTKLLRRRRQF